MNKELFYIKKIGPLMAEVHELCRKNGISMLSMFDLGDDLEPYKMATTWTMEPDDTHPLITSVAMKLMNNEQAVKN